MPRPCTVLLVCIRSSPARLTVEHLPAVLDFVPIGVFKLFLAIGKAPMDFMHFEPGLEYVSDPD